MDFREKEKRQENIKNIPKKDSSEKTEVKTKNAKCFTCNDTVYPIDKIEVNEKIYHKNCVKCAQCKKVLDLSSFRKHEEVFYCIKHYGKLLLK
jgi:uncharacterized CHY-type Zn-finger protein